MNKQKFATKDLVLCAIFSALIAVGGFVKIPVGLVPLTFQFYFCVFSALILGGKMGSISVFSYILIGLVGLPVFANGGGIAYIFQPSFGYLIGMYVGSYVGGTLAQRAKIKNIYTDTKAALAMLAVVYAIGLPYLYLVFTFYLHKSINLQTLLVSYCLIFLPNDLFSCFAASFFAQKLRKLI